MIQMEEIQKMEYAKLNSACKIDRMVMDELLEMGFSYKRTGTNQLHDVIVFMIKRDTRSYTNTRDAVRDAYRYLAEKYGGKRYCYQTHISNAIDNAFQCGNIDRLLEVFKESYDYSVGKVSNTTFIMTVRRRVMIRMEEESQLLDADKLREAIREAINEITSASALTSLCGIALALKGGAV